MLTPCIFAIEVSVSPRATVWLLPLPLFAAASVAAAVDVTVDVVELDAELAGAPSPIMTPGRRLVTSSSSLRISCESMSILAFCSSIFLVSSCNCAVWLTAWFGVGAMVCANPWEQAKANKKTSAPGNLMGLEFCHQPLALASGGVRAIRVACLYPFSP